MKQTCGSLYQISTALCNIGVYAGYIQSKNIIYDIFVLKANAIPLKSLDKPITVLRT